MITLKNEYMTCSFDENKGQLREISRGGLTLGFDGLGFDFGCDEKMAVGLLEYQSMLEFRTWNLPGIVPTGAEFDLIPAEYTYDEKSFTADFHLEKARVKLYYELEGEALRVRLEIANLTSSPLYLNTCAFVLGLNQVEDVVFDFPANTPIQHCHAAELKPLEAVQTGLINFAVHTALSGGDFNLLFIDDIEKWGCGVYRDETCTRYVYDAGLEMDLAPESVCEVGTLYLMPCEAGTQNPYLQIRDLTARLGYTPCTGGIHEGVMYSCHPSGTMDAGFPLKTDLFEYADYLPTLKKMGVDHVWLLPVFEHNEEGVYHSNDQSVIDPRYGGEEGCKYFCHKAHELGMTVLFDYVPHGPAPEFPVAKDNPEWPAKRRDGSLQDEWECVSMDYNHPGYQEYTTRLVHDHVKRFGVDGARIDCAMGGLSNWRPYRDNRPSGNSVLAGVHITEAIRSGFLRGGKKSFILPENFNPLPNYYHCTDLFYGMNLYRAFVDLQPLLSSDPAQYAALLTDFLEREAWITPPNYHKMRFLGNHDTVSWVWQSARAVDCYGAGAARALFALIALMDGVPMIYQGDEDPSLYGGKGENLTAYFTLLFGHRKAFIPKGNSTEWLHTNSPLMAFVREGEVMVLINLSQNRQEYDFAGRQVRLLAASAENGQGAEDTVTLGRIPAYGYQIVRCL